MCVFACMDVLLHLCSTRRAHAYQYVLDTVSDDGVVVFFLHDPLTASYSCVLLHESYAVLLSLFFCP